MPKDWVVTRDRQVEEAIRIVEKAIERRLSKLERKWIEGELREWAGRVHEAGRRSGWEGHRGMLLTRALAIAAERGQRLEARRPERAEPEPLPEVPEGWEG